VEVNVMIIVINVMDLGALLCCSLHCGLKNQKKPAIKSASSLHA